MSKPIYKTNIINNEMIPDFKLFEKFWMKYFNILDIDQHEFDNFIKIINKIRNNDFDFNEEGILNFNKFLERTSSSIHTFKNDAEIYDEEYDGEILYDDEHLICCHKIKNHLKFISEPVLDYEKMKENNTELAEDLCKNVFDPERIDRLSDKLELEMCDYLDML